MLKKVLIIDDSALIHRKYTLVLKRYGCAIVSAIHGREGMERLAENPDVDLILLGMHMPVMDGFAFLGALKQEKRHGHIPIIILATEGREEDTLAGLALGARGSVRKDDAPHTLHVLIERISTTRRSCPPGAPPFAEGRQNGTSPGAGCQISL